MFWILLIGVAVGILFKPRLFTFLGLFFFEILFFSRENTGGALIAAIVLGAIACLRMELTEDRSAILYKVPGYDCKEPPMNGFIIHAAIIGVIYAASFYVLWVWSLAAQPGTRFLRLLIIYPAIALGVPLISEFLAPRIMHGRIIDTYNKEVEAERQRVLAEQEAKRKEEEAGRAAELARIKANQEAILRFWDLLISDYNVNPNMKEYALGKRRIPFSLSADVPSVWVRNDERIKKIEEIIQSAGFHAGASIGGMVVHKEEEPSHYRFESPFLDSILYDEWPIRRSSTDFLRAAMGRRRITGDGWVLPDEYTFGFHDTISDAISLANEKVKQCFAEYRKEYEIIKSGLKGEYAVQEVLDMHAGSLLVLHDLRLEFPNGGQNPDSVEIDTLVLAINGIFALETKNYGESGRYKIIVTSDGNWYKEFPSRHGGDRPKRESMQNPFKQNDRHIAFLEKLINEILGRDMGTWAYVENIICIANDEVELENDPGAKQTLTRTSNLYNQITHDRTPKFTVEELNRVKEALESRSLPGKKYPLLDYSEDLKSIVNRYNFYIDNQCLVTIAAGECAQDHPEFLTMIK